MGWDARPELIAEIRASIVPVRTDASLGKVLAEDFPRDCTNLPISGGWGYSRDDAIVFIRELFPLSAMPAFVPVEYHIVQKIIYEELVIPRPKDSRFSGITKTRKQQSLVESDGRQYDRLEFLISCWSDRHWNQLKQECLALVEVSLSGYGVDIVLIIVGRGPPDLSRSAPCHPRTLRSAHASVGIEYGII